MHQERQPLSGDTFMTYACMDCDAETQAKQATIDQKVKEGKWASDALALPVDILHFALNKVIMELDHDQRKVLTGHVLRRAGAEAALDLGGGSQGRARANASLARHGIAYCLGEHVPLHDMPPRKRIRVAVE